MSERPGLVWLRFEDAALERAYEIDHARRSVLPVRVMSVVLAIASALVAVAMMTGDAAEAVGLSLPDMSEGPWFWTRSVASLLAMGALLAFVSHRAVLPRQQVFIATLLAVLLLCDTPSAAGIPLAYGLSSTLVQVMTAYVLLRLRLRYAAIVAIATSVAYLSFAAAAHGTDAGGMGPAFRVNATVLFTANGILAAACHQIERLDRLAFLGRHRLELRSQALATALRELEEAQTQLVETERQASLGRLAAGLLHELNNPLAVVRSTSDALARSFERSLSRASAPDPRAVKATRHLLDAQAEGARRLSRVLSGLERFVDLDREGERPVDLREGLRDALNLLGARLEGVEVTDTLGDEPLWVRCDPARMHAAFFAVLDNAANALGGRGRLRLSQHREDGWWRLDIADDGPGIPEDLVPTLFEPRITRHGSRVKMRLGLPTARRAAEACGGTLQLVSGSESGARFRFELPVASRPIPEVVARPEPHEPAPSAQPPVDVLQGKQDPPAPRASLQR